MDYKDILKEQIKLLQKAQDAALSKSEYDLVLRFGITIADLAEKYNNY